MSNEYMIYGNTYQIKEELKAYACRFVLKEKAWKTPSLDKDELSFKRLKGLVEAIDGEMVPIKLSPEAQKVQDALKGV